MTWGFHFMLWFYDFSWLKKWMPECLSFMLLWKNFPGWTKLTTQMPTICSNVSTLVKFKQVSYVSELSIIGSWQASVAQWQTISHSMSHIHSSTITGNFNARTITVEQAKCTPMLPAQHVYLDSQWNAIRDTMVQSNGLKAWCPELPVFWVYSSVMAFGL